MKKHLKIIPFIIAVSILLSFSVNALDKSKVISDAPRNEHVFTKAELACMSDSVFGLSSENNEEFVEIKNIEGKTTRASTTYYIIEMNDGYMLTSPSSGTFSRTRYANSGSNDVRKWIFTEDNDGNYIVYSNTDKAKCLTVNPSTGNVSLSNYTGSKYQKWKMYYSGNGNALSSMATDSPVYGYKLVINSTSCSVSNTTFTPVGFFDVSWYVPVSTLSYPNFYLALDQKKTVTPNKTPENAITSNNWIKWSTTFPRITIDGKGRVTGVVEGVTGLTFTDKITRKTGSCIVNVTCLPNGTYFLKNKETSNYAKVKNATMADNQNVVQYDFEGSASQRWIFTLNSSTGYYSIRSANSAYHYMAVRNDSTFNDMPIVIMGATESTLTDGMKWTVSKLPDGAYKITPKTGESNGYVLATSTSLETNNAGLVQGDYINNNSYRDEWILTKIQYDATVLNYYDMGYPIRYGESTSVASSKIDNYIDSVARQYLRLFGLELTTNTATYYQSPLDVCKGVVNSSNIDTMCSHGGVIHSERNNVISDFNTAYVGDTKKTYVLWSCHKIVSTATNGDTNYNRSCSFNTGIYLIEISYTHRERDSQAVLMHELNHQYGAKDHYHELKDKNDPNSCKFKERCSECGDNPRPSSCIMNQARIDITNDDVICTACQNDILVHLNGHHSK